LIQLIFIATGGATGALLRYFLGNVLKNTLYNNFFSISLINILGSFLIGLLISIGKDKNLPEDFIKYFLIIGFLGSFTTFSSFSYEVIELFLSSKVFISILYVILSVTLCILAALVGLYINKF